MRKRSLVEMHPPCDKFMACTLCKSHCLPEFDKLVTGKCGHVICQRCQRQIIAKAPNNWGPYDQQFWNVSHPHETIRLDFNFNFDKKECCHLCDIAFKAMDSDADDNIQFLRCGHIFHKMCMLSNTNHCFLVN